MTNLIQPAPQPGLIDALTTVASGMVLVLTFLGCAAMVALILVAVGAGFQVRNSRGRDQHNPQPAAPWDTHTGGRRQ